jgi:major membrane immunogen (membrane-anchored lipoprotein)
MKWAVYLVAVFVAAGCGASDADKALTARCVPDADKMMSLKYAAFDQDPSGGWRSLATQTGCDGAIADLIARYRKSKGKEPGQADTLAWHEAQARAMAGETDRAIKLFQQPPQDAPPETSPYGVADGLYRTATIAFLQNDKPALEAARTKLAAVPEPADFAELKASIRKKMPGAAPPAWPMNLDVVDGLIACFGKPYKQAYDADCRPGPQKGSRQTQAADAGGVGN